MLEWHTLTKNKTRLKQRRMMYTNIFSYEFFLLLFFLTDLWSAQPCHQCSLYHRGFRLATELFMFQKIWAPFHFLLIYSSSFCLVKLNFWPGSFSLAIVQDSCYWDAQSTCLLTHKEMFICWKSYEFIGIFFFNAFSYKSMRKKKSRLLGCSYF